MKERIGALLFGRLSTSLGVVALQSIGNFVMALAILRVSGTARFGEYSVALTLMVIFVGFVRSVLIEPALGKTAAPRELLVPAANRALVLGVAAGCVCLLVGWLFHLPFVVVLGLVLPGALLFEACRVVQVVEGRPQVALQAQMAAAAGSLLAALLVWSHLISGPAGFLVANLVLGLVAIGLLAREEIRPSMRWTSWPIPERSVLGFAWDYLVGTGSGQLTTVLIGTFVGVHTVGTLRVGATLLSPASMLLAAVTSLLIGRLAARVNEPSSGVLVELRLTLLLICAVAPLLVLPFVMPGTWGEYFAGSDWTEARAVLVWLALEMVFTTVGLVPYAGHRAHLASLESARIRTVLGLIRLAAVPLSAFAGGARGAAIALAVLSLIGSGSWWLSYRAVNAQRAVVV